jgi:Periplasmic serine proteases (ClpP class)
MHRKAVVGLCETVASYQGILKAIDMVEQLKKEDKIDNCLFRITSVGGTAAQVDLVEEAISNMSMPTSTLYEVIGASAAIYAFSAANKIYATRHTKLGSIGAVAIFEKQKEDSDKIVMVSKRAENKIFDITDKKHKEKYQSDLDILEEDFYKVIEKNTGFTAKDIEEKFDKGGVITADKAKEIGFITEVISYSKLIEKLNSTNTAAMPSDSEKIVNIEKGANMEFTEENFKLLIANRNTLQGRLDSISLQLETVTAALVTKDEEIESLKADIDSKLSGAKAEIENYKTTVSTRLQEASASKVDLVTALAMVNASSDEEATKLALDANPTQALNQGEGADKKESGILAFCSQNKGSIR